MGNLPRVPYEEPPAWAPSGGTPRRTKKEREQDEKDRQKRERDDKPVE